MMQENKSSNRITPLEVYNAIKGYILEVARIDRGVDKLGTIEEIKNKKSMGGANAWMLICSIVIASIGLSQNSQAVIIGAMLISPLMSPILGIGLGVGINDRETLFQSLKHLGIAIIITLMTSTIYFFFTPFSEITPEIEARTQPTFLDVFIAIFGGVAGIVSIARKDISTTLPGVAIATALMPPLCVTGFGLANGNIGIASKSFYLFFLNTFFVALATYLFVRFLHFPLREYINPVERRRNFYTVGVIALAAIIPSFLIFRGVLNDVRLEKRTQTFINEYLGKDKIYLDEYEIVANDSTNLLILKVYGNIISPEKIPEYNDALVKYGLPNTRIEILQTSEVDISDVATLESKISGIEKIAAQLEVTTRERENQQVVIDMLESNISDIQIDSTLFIDVVSEVKTIFPELQEIGLAKVQKSNFEEYNRNVPIALIQWQKGLRNSSMQTNEERMKNFLIERLDLDTLMVIRY